MPRELPGLYKAPGAASKCSNHVAVLLKRSLRLAGLGGEEEEEEEVVEEAEGGESKPRQKEVWVSRFHPNGTSSFLASMELPSGC